MERLKVAGYLNRVAYNYPEDCPPKLDRTAFNNVVLIGLIQSFVLLKLFS